MYDEKRIEVIKQWLGSGSIDIFGRPFSGKDAQGRRIADMFSGSLVGSGDILRSSHVEKQTRTGVLTPTKDFLSIVLPYLKQESLRGKPLILSSVGRWHGEETGVMEALTDSDHDLRAVVYLGLTNEESHSRWLARETNNDRNGRHDDTEDVLKTRFNEFQEKTIPVIDFYRDLGLLIEIDGKQTREKVTSDILDCLFKLASVK